MNLSLDLKAEALKLDFLQQVSWRGDALFLSDISLPCAALQIAAHTPLTIYGSS